MSRIFLGAFGDPGHAFPMLALGGALVARGHEVSLQTWEQWREPAARLGIGFAGAPEYQVWPTREKPLKPYAAAVLAARETLPQIKAFAPEAVVADILTPAPALAAELAGVPFSTLIPHVFPWMPSGFAPYSIGARLPRTRLGRELWRRSDGMIARGLEQGREEYNECRRRLGLPPLPYVHTGLSRELTMIATLPQLEYPRDWPAWTRVVGPLLWEPPGPSVAPPPGEDPVVLVAPSTSQDPERTLLRAALAGLADAPVRVIASWNGELDPSVAVPGNAVVVPWLSYAAAMPSCDLVLCHGGHGTLARALVSGCPVVIVPAAGDMGENAARVDRLGLGVRLPRRYGTARGVRLAVERALSRPGLREHARAVARWASAHDGPAAAAAAIERWLARRG